MTEKSEGRVPFTAVYEPKQMLASVTAACQIRGKVYGLLSKPACIDAGQRYDGLAAETVSSLPSGGYQINPLLLKKSVLMLVS